MMRPRNVLALSLMAFMAVGMNANSKIDLLSRVRMRDAQLNLNVPVLSGDSSPRRKSALSYPGTIRAFITLSGHTDSKMLEAEGVEISAVMGNVALCVMQIEDVEHIAELDYVSKVTIDTPRQLMSRGARGASNIDAIHAGEGLPSAYTGKNVICGIFDQGLDPNHVNFLNENGTSRVTALSHLRLNGAGYPVFSDYDNETVSLFETDEPATYHGTHTLGIMAGGYKGALTSGYPEGYNIDGGNPYYGMAPEADLFVTCGPTSDYFIANGVAKIVDYAIEKRHPAVINLSLGGNIGTHDGNSAMSQFLELAGDYSIIVVAAGNEGNIPLHANKTFHEGDNEFKTLLKAYYEPETNDNLRYGQVAIYSDDESVFEIQGVIYNRKTGKVAYRIPLPSPGTGVGTYHISDIEYKVSDEDIVSQPLSKYFNGYFGLGSAIDEDTGKFYCVIDYYLTNNQEKNADDMYVPGFIVKGSEGQTARIWCDGSFTQFDSYGEEGWSEGTTDGTISDMATAHNVVVVGSYNTDGTLHNLDGSHEPFEPSLGEFVPGEVTSFSAYGTLADGRQLPHVCAPGVTLVSSTSRYYVEAENNGIDSNKMSAVFSDNGINHWWSQTGGTSMATPVVAGAIALWLEADPTLTVDKVIDIIRKTAVVDDQVMSAKSPVQWGAGKFDAYAGLVEVLRQSGVNSIYGAGSSLLLTNNGNRVYTVALPGVSGLNIEVYSMSGARVASANVTTDSYELDLSHIAAGVYVVCANGIAREKIILK